MNLFSLKIMLEMWGFTGELQRFQSSTLALEHIKEILDQKDGKNSLDLIITDANIPIMNGLTLIREVQELVKRRADNMQFKSKD